MLSHELSISGKSGTNIHDFAAKITALGVYKADFLKNSNLYDSET